MSIRSHHVGKNPQEREAYKDFLSSKFRLDKTIEDEDKLMKSDSSSVDEEELKRSKVTPKSWGLKAKDFFENNWVVGFGVAFIMLIVAGYIDVKSDQGVVREKISGVETRVTELEKDTKNQKDLLSKLSENISVFKSETGKEIEFIKERFKNLIK